MKKFIYQLIISVLITLVIFIMKEDIVSVIDKVSSGIKGNIEIQKINISGNGNEAEFSGGVNLPGALRVANEILNQKNEINLSSEKIISLTNEQRKNNGDLPALVENNKLNISAEKKLQDMFDKQYFEHISPEGVGVANLSEEVGYDFVIIGENLAMGNFKNDLSLVEAWMASPGHRANILNEHYSEIGVAVGKGVFDGKIIWMAVQHFGTPKNVCPKIDHILLGAIDINREKIKNMETDLSLRKNMIDRGVVYGGSTYFEQIKSYNDLVIEYNNLVNGTRKLVDGYNNQVHKFNECILEYQ